MTEHANVTAMVEHLSKTTDDVYEVLPGDPDDPREMVYFFDQDLDCHMFIEWADESGWLITWQCSAGAPNSAKLPTPDAADAVKTAETIAAIRAGEIDEFETVGA